MAHVMKATRSQTGGLTRHFERAKNEKGEYLKFGNQEIDITQTHLNYNLAPQKNQLNFIKERTSEIQCLNRKNVNVMANWLVTAPQFILDNPEKEKEFFQETYNYLSNLYGEKNIISAYVHKDESTPHLHFSFIPVVMDSKKNIEKVSAKELLNKEHLQKFHDKLSDHMTNFFGQDIGIINGATVEKNLSINQLKLKTVKEELSELENQKTELEKLKEDIKNLKKENKNLTEKIKNKKEEFEKIDIKNNKISVKTKTGEITKEFVSEFKPKTNILNSNTATVNIDDLKKLRVLGLRHFNFIDDREKLKSDITNFQKIVNQKDTQLMILEKRIPNINEQMEQSKINSEYRKIKKIIDKIEPETLDKIEKEIRLENKQKDKGQER